jgi:metal-responsive CopG/Arc/MetJ family transcriptional regulator
MKRNSLEGKKTTKAEGPSWVRASISFPPSLYETLTELARQKKVSLAWVVRDAAERYIAGKRPGLGASKGK